MRKEGNEHRGNKYAVVVPSTTLCNLEARYLSMISTTTIVNIPVDKTGKQFKVVIDDVATYSHIMFINIITVPLWLILLPCALGLKGLKFPIVAIPISLVIYIIFGGSLTMAVIAWQYYAIAVIILLLFADLKNIRGVLAKRVNHKSTVKEVHGIEYIRRLGGKAYLAKYLNNKVVVKEYSKDPRAFNIVMKSVSTWLKLSADPSTHPDIVKVLQVDNMSKRIVMEYVDGVNLWNYMVEHSVRSEKTLNIVEKLSEVMCSVNSRKPPIVHRDLKPENIIVTKSGDIKICDWKYAIEIQGREFIDTDIVGTPGYMHPDALQGRYSAKTDVFAIASILFEMITGKPLSLATYSSTMLDPYFEDKRIARSVADLIGEIIAGKVEDACEFRESLRKIIDLMK